MAGREGLDIEDRQRALVLADAVGRRAGANDLAKHAPGGPGDHR
jgi:hypothetical protein